MKTMLSLATFSSLLLARPAHAREVEYQAPPDCPDAAVVKARIEASAPEGRPARIDVVREELLFRGDLVLGAGDGRLRRSVTAKTCNAVVDALTLVVSLDRDPAETPTETLASVDEPEPTPRDRGPDTTRPPRPAPTTELGFGLSGAETSWSAVFITGLAAFGDLTLRRGWWEPSARLAIGRTFERQVGSGGFAVALTTVSLEGCPLGIAHGIARTSVCVRSDAGVIRAQEVAGPQNEDDRRWSALGGMVRERIGFGGPETARPFVELGAGVMAPLVRHRYHVGGSVDEVPVAQAALSLGVGVVMP